MSQIRQAKAEATIQGILKEKDLKIEPVMRDGVKVNAIKGQLTIATDGVSEHIIKIFSYEKTAKGEKNKSFESCKVAMEQFLSVADALKSGLTKDDADVIEVKGCQASVNEYYNTGGVLVSRHEMKGSFLSRAKDKDPANFKAGFDIEIFYIGLKPEMSRGEETGRTLVNAILPMYNGIVAPIQFVCEGEVANYLDMHYEKNRSGRVWGNIVNRVIRTTNVIAGFGAGKEETNTSYVNELYITGGVPEQYDVDDEKMSWDKASIADAMTERDLRLEVAKAKAENGGNKKASTPASNTGNGRPSF